MTDSERQMQIDQFKNRMRAADIPVRHAGFKLDQNTCQAWADKLETLKGKLKTGCIVALYGNRGTGKTQMASELIRATCWAGRSALYRRVMEFYIEIKSTYGGKTEETEAEIIAKYAKPSLLVLDEAHERGGTAWESSLLALLLDKRYAGLKDTIIIANLDKAGLVTALGPSITRRLNETGGLVACDWDVNADLSGKERPGIQRRHWIMTDE